MTLSPSPSRARGFSIVELMVGMVIALIGILVVMQVYSLSEARKRTTTSGGDAQTNGALSLYMVERETRQAGYGFASTDVFNCNVRAYNENRDPQEFTFQSMAPVVINPANIPAGDANTDVIQITYGSAEGMGEGVEFEQQSGASANYKVKNRSEFTVGDMVIAVQSGLDCTIAQVTDLPASGTCGSGGGGQTDVVIHNSGNFKDPGQNCNTVESHWNKPGGLGVTYTNGKLYNLGRLPTSHVYAVRNGNLTMCDFTVRDCTDAAKVNDATVWVPVVNNIVLMQAQYGRDTSATMDKVVDVYDKTTPTTACGYARTLAVRIALVARSAQYEKTALPAPYFVTGAFAAAWPGNALNLAGLTDWDHYRYKLFQTVVPLKNILWMSGTC